MSLPPHVPHRWQNIGTTPGHLFGIATPGGFERFFLELATGRLRTAEDFRALHAELGIIDGGLIDQMAAHAATMPPGD